MRKRNCTWGVVGVVLLAYATLVVAQDGERIDESSESCLSMNRVRSANAIDDRTIVFDLRDGRIYLNYLDIDCPGLRQNNRFSYNVRTGARIPRLCHTDSVTVIEPSGDGFTCGLGRFEPISAAAVEEMRRDPNESAPEVHVIDIEATETKPEPDESE